MRVLSVAEKPSVAKAISRILAGNGRITQLQSSAKYNPVMEFNLCLPPDNREVTMVFTSVRGHLMELEFPPEFSNWSQINPVMLLHAPVHRRVADVNKDLHTNLKTLSQNCQALILWLDCDREGEAIAFEVVEICQTANRNITVSRATFSAVTPSDVHRAISSLHPPDENLAHAVAVRQELDLRIGASLTRLMTLRFRRRFDMPTKVISYGPCQFPTLGFVVSRYIAIQKFVSENFWHLDLEVEIENQPVPLKWKRTRLFDLQMAVMLYQKCLLNPVARVPRVLTSPTTKYKPLPMNTVTMTKLAAKHLKLKSHECMSLAESLYNKGILSYPRTETDAFPKTMNLQHLVERQAEHPDWGDYARNLTEGNNFALPRGGSRNDAAHPPIHPVKAVTRADCQSDREWQLFELITKHFLAICSKDAEGQQTLIEVTVDCENFTATGLVVTKRNFLEVWGQYESWAPKTLPRCHPNTVLPIRSLILAEGSTTPPSLLSEVELITRMDKYGIGTDATMHEHIRTIETRQYVERIGDRFQPTVLGLALYQGYHKCSRALVNPELRAETEQAVAAVAVGSVDKTSVLQREIAKYQELYRAVGANLNELERVLATHFPAGAGSNTSNGNGLHR